MPVPGRDVTRTSGVVEATWADAVGSVFREAHPLKKMTARTPVVGGRSTGGSGMGEKGRAMLSPAPTPRWERESRERERERERGHAVPALGRTACSLSSTGTSRQPRARSRPLALDTSMAGSRVWPSSSWRHPHAPAWGKPVRSPALSRSRGSRRHVAASRMPGRCERLHHTRRGSRDGARVTGPPGRSGRQRSAGNAQRKAPMSSATAARGALLRRAGTLLVAPTHWSAPLPPAHWPTPPRARPRRRAPRHPSRSRPPPTRARRGPKAGLPPPPASGSRRPTPTSPRPPRRAPSQRPRAAPSAAPPADRHRHQSRRARGAPVHPQLSSRLR